MMWEWDREKKLLQSRFGSLSWLLNPNHIGVNAPKLYCGGGGGGGVKPCLCFAQLIGKKYIYIETLDIISNNIYQTGIL